MVLFRVSLLIFALLGAGCATIVKSDRQTVQFTGGPEEQTAKIKLPDGTHELVGGSTTALVSRSKSDIPIEVTCNGQTRKGVIKTSFDPLAGVAGNIVFGGLIGLAIDIYGDKAYDVKSPYNIDQLCETRSTASQGPLK